MRWFKKSKIVEKNINSNYKTTEQAEKEFTEKHPPKYNVGDKFEWFIILRRFTWGLSTSEYGYSPHSWYYTCIWLSTAQEIDFKEDKIDIMANSKNYHK